MLYIKKIELRGFKSFGPKTTSVFLDKGFTVMTGPNGSGKTNIVDAVLFGLGELSARRLRAENFAKLIFHGAPDGEAERVKGAKVVIQFDNPDGRIPIDTSTVTISREVHRNGQSVYRLNGRRISRTNIVDTLSMAGISSTGHNVVVQGTITRMAEISPLERRKIIDDMVGIAQYDLEKAEAEEKLRAAEISIRTAMGRIDEVQKRVDDLERERNQLLRYDFIQDEIKKFEAMKISHEIQEIQTKSQDLSSKIEQAGSRAERLRQMRDQMRSQRREVETEWRQFSSEGVEKSSTRVLEVQIKIGDLKSRLTELATKIGADTTSMEGLRKVRDNDLQQLEAVKKETDENRKGIRQLKLKHNQLSKEIGLKQSNHDALSTETTQLWTSLGENGKKIKEVEQRLDRLYRNLVTLRSEHGQSRTTIRVWSRQLEELKARKERFTSTLNDLNKSLTDLTEVQTEQRTRLKNLQRTLDRRTAQKEAMEREIAQADKIADSAREAVVEFVTQRELAETVASEEKALRSIEEMGELGVIQGVFGRLRNLVKTERNYEQAMEAAAAGWLDSIVVQNFDTAFTCTETLKRLKLGRIKIIPLKELFGIQSIRRPKVKGVSEAASELVKHSKQFEPAVTFVFGDTLIAKDEKAALAACREGHRAVTVSGDLFEAGGGIECGYYRAPIDFSRIIPSEPAVKSLDDAVRALKEHLTRRGNDITSLKDEIDRTKVETAKLNEAIGTLEGEITRLRRRIKHTSLNVNRINKFIYRIKGRLQKERAQIGVKRAQRNTLQKETRKLRGELSVLRRKVDPSHIQEFEVRRGKLGDELVELRQRLGGVETDLSTARSKLKNVLNTGYKNIKIQLRKVESQLFKVEGEVKEAILERIGLEKELKELESSKEELSRSILSARKESKKFIVQIDEIDKDLQRIDTSYERAEKLLSQLQLGIQTLQLQQNQLSSRLTELGYEKPLVVSPDQLQAVDSTLRLMKLELERLGAVNQLAGMHYAEQISRYKELSIRVNELEKEKQSIVAFMEEIEGKKRKVFMKAFDKVNNTFSRYFSKLTGGGEAALKLEKPEEPLSGGMDMTVQFPSKPPILVSGASSGERSVTAVAFLFALQDFMPAAFYLLDEVDAHLDAFHVARLGELLAEESDRSQFLVITLKPEMVSKAQRIYGVYERNGVSHVVSTTLEEAA